MHIGVIIAFAIAVPYGIANTYLLSRKSNKFGMVIEYLALSDMIVVIKTMLIGVLFTIASVVGIAISFILAPFIVLELGLLLLFPKLGGKLK